MIKNKRAFEFSFSWLFAIIMGAVIIFLAIYAANKFIGTERAKQDTELGKELGIILLPIETGLETAKTSKISFPFETRLYNDCISSNVFGSQKISTATKSGIGNAWEKPGLASTFYNKYIFSEKILEGKDYFVFSKPFEMPFKIASLIYLWPKDEQFCFIAPPNEIQEEITDLQLENIFIDNCPPKAKKVCFTGSGCDIDVTLLGSSSEIKGSLKRKYSNKVYFETTALFYGAIFADPEIYECQVKRLMKRASELSLIYYAKSTLLSPKGCSSNLESSLVSYANQTFSINNSLDLISYISQDSDSLRRRNNDLDCKLF